MQKILRNLLVLIGLLFWMAMHFTACKEDTINTDPQFRLAFSADTLHIDTIFTDKGSATYKLKVYNQSAQKAHIHQIRLMEGVYFHLNITGHPVDEMQDVYLNAHDSLLMFVQVNIDPTEQTTPFLVADSILFLVNNVQQWVHLEAYGQNAVRLNNVSVTTDSVLTNTMPYLIGDTLRVKKGATLTIEPGARLYFQKNAVLYVEGTLVAEGTWQKPIEFRGDRDDYMNTIPPLSYNLCSGQWGGMVIASGSFGNRLVHADVRNGNFGVRIDSTDTRQLALYVESSMLRNVVGNVLEATHAKVEVNNSLLYNAGNYVVTVRGGSYTWRHCTFSNYYSFSWGGREMPILHYCNTWVDSNGVEQVLPFLSNMYNSIIYGSYTTEIQYQLHESTPPDAYLFANCLLRIKIKEVNDPPYRVCLFNKDPLFTFQQQEKPMPHVYDFTIQSGSGAIGIGDMQHAQAFPLDLNGNKRTTDGAPDAGCYEYVD